MSSNAVAGRCCLLTVARMLFVTAVSALCAVCLCFTVVPPAGPVAASSAGSHGAACAG